MQRVSWHTAIVRMGLVCLCLMPAAGCGQKSDVVVPGTVTLNGQPLASGVVRIHGPGDRLTTTPLKPDGSFVMTDVKPGEIKVTVAEEAGGGSIPAPKGGVELPPGTISADVKSVPIPKKYQDVSTSGLSFTITSETKSLQINLEGDAATEKAAVPEKASIPAEKASVPAKKTTAPTEKATVPAEKATVPPKKTSEGPRTQQSLTCCLYWRPATTPLAVDVPADSRWIIIDVGPDMVAVS